MRTIVLRRSCLSILIPRRNEATLWKRWEPHLLHVNSINLNVLVGMKPLSERDENHTNVTACGVKLIIVGMKPLSERDENSDSPPSFSALKLISRNEATLWKRWELLRRGMCTRQFLLNVGMKPLSERDENLGYNWEYKKGRVTCRNEATLWKRWELIDEIRQFLRNA